MQDELKKHRRRTGQQTLPPRDGGPVMRGLFFWDLFVICSTVPVAATFLAWRGYGYHEWMAWLVLEMVKVTYAILAVPYLALAVAKDSITGTAATGYDRQGWLCRQLNLEEVRDVRSGHPRNHEQPRRPAPPR